MAKYVARVLSTLFFVGYFPIAPGTLASFVALGMAWFLLPEGLAVNLAVCAAIILLSLWASSQAEKVFGEDDHKIVIDEVAGMLVSILMLPKSINLYLAAFFLFRFFDVVKPPPVRNLENLKSGWGVTSDDLMAGIYANVTLRFLLYLKRIF